MWLSAIKLAINAGSKIYANKQKAKIAMSDAQLLHAERQARGEEAYQGKLLEARQSDWKDEFVLVVLTLPILVIAYGVFSDDPAAGWVHISYNEKGANRKQVLTYDGKKFDNGLPDMKWKDGKVQG